MQYTSLPDGFTIQELDASHLEQFNALLRYAFQVTEEELVQVGWQELSAYVMAQGLFPSAASRNLG